MGFTINTDNLEKKLNNISKEMRDKGSREAVENTMEEAFRRSDRLVPRESGHLAASGSVQSEQKGSRARAAIVYSADYAEIIEFRVKSYLRAAMIKHTVANDLNKETSAELNSVIRRNT